MAAASEEFGAPAHETGILVAPLDQLHERNPFTPDQVPPGDYPENSR
ncbi:MAG TPA: hypothetical protein VNQ90_19530 [Chthoniobacteraceae bacterium]|nr:hypothetical protein [Chthoniobacteraceae bacterium]